MNILTNYINSKKLTENRNTQKESFWLGWIQKHKPDNDEYHTEISLVDKLMLNDKEI